MSFVNLKFIVHILDNFSLDKHKFCLQPLSSKQPPVFDCEFSKAKIRNQPIKLLQKTCATRQKIGLEDCDSSDFNAYRDLSPAPAHPPLSVRVQWDQHILTLFKQADWT